MGKACPICGKTATATDKPFCSRRCADLDLGKWFTGSYAVPAVELDDIDEESPDGGGETPQ